MNPLQGGTGIGQSLAVGQPSPSTTLQNPINVQPSPIGGSVLGMNTTNSGNINTGSTGTTGPTADELTSLNSQLGNIYSGATGAFGNAVYQANAFSQPFLNSLLNSQVGINTQRQQNAAQNYLSLQNIAQGLRQGLQSGAVKLAAAGASSSSAAGDLARLENNQAAGQNESVIQQTGLTNSQLDNQQTALKGETQNTVQQIDAYKNGLISQIQTNVASQLAALEQQAAAWGAPAPDESQKNAIINQGIAQLSQVDQYIQGQLGSSAYQPESYGQAQQDVYGTLNSGSVPQVPSIASYTGTPQVQGTPQTGLGGTGAPLTNLPLYLKNQT